LGLAPLASAIEIPNPASRGLALGAQLALPVYRFSTAAIIGIANAVLSYLYGNWVFTGALMKAASAAQGPAPSPDPQLWILFAAMLAGMIVSALTRRSFSLELPGSAAAVRHLLGGAMMGWGLAMIPGGNASLILHYIPFFSPHALPAFLAMLAGIAAALVAAPWMGMARPKVACSGDICRMDAASISP